MYWYLTVMLMVKTSVATLEDKVEKLGSSRKAVNILEDICGMNKAINLEVNVDLDEGDQAEMA